MPRKLRVHLSTASNLLAADKNGKSDPFCTLQLLECGSGKEVEKKKSKTCKKTLNPAWDEWFDFSTDVDCPAASLPSLRVTVFDADTLSSEPLGEFTVSLSDYFDNLITNEHIIDVNLQNTEKMKKTTATGFVSFSVNFTLPFVDNSVPLSEEVVDLQSPPMPLPPHIIPDDLSQHHENITNPNCLHIILLRARNLPIMDKPGMLSRKKGPGSSDPLVTMHTGDKDNKVTSTVKKKDLNPVWDEHFTLHVTDPALSLTMTVDDYDMGSGNDFMGQIKVPMVDLKTGEESRVWRRLANLQGDDTSKSLGDILVGLHWVYDNDLKLPEKSKNIFQKAKASVTGDSEQAAAGVDATPAEVQELTDLDLAEQMQTIPSLKADDVKMDGKIPNELHVLVIKAKYILAMDGKGILGGIKAPSFGRRSKKKQEDGEAGKKKTKTKGTSDPFVSVTTSSKNSPTFKTDTIKKTLEPVWKSNNKFVINETDPGSKIEFEIRDADKLTTEFMGKLVIDMKKLSSRREVREWFQFTDKNGRVDKDRGRLLLALRWVYNPLLLTEAEAADDSNMGPPFPESVKDFNKNKKPNRIHCYVIRAKGLQIMDKNMFTSGGSSDPYVKINFDEESKQTRVIKKQTNPIWMEHLYFDRVLSMQSKNIIEISVFDHDLGSGDDFMGYCKVPLSSLSDRREVRKWFNLTNKQSTNDGKTYGSLLLALWHCNDPTSKPPLDKGFIEELESLPPAVPKTIAPSPIVKKTVKKVVKEEPVVVATYGNWQETIDPESRDIYWYNKATRKSTWLEPEFVKKEKKRLMILRVQKYTKESLLGCSQSAYSEYAYFIQMERDRAFEFLSKIAKAQIYENKCKQLIRAMMHTEIRWWRAAFSKWNHNIHVEEKAEQNAACMEIQRCVRSYLLRRRQAETELGMRLHYIRNKVKQSMLDGKEKSAFLAKSDNFPLVGEMAIEQLLDEGCEVLYNEAVATYLVEEEDALNRDAAKEDLRQRQETLDAEMDAAFSSEDEEERVAAEKNVQDGQEEFMKSMMNKYKLEDEVKRGLTPKEALRPRPSLTDDDIVLACEKIEDNILTRALDGIIEEVEYYMDNAFSLQQDIRDVIYESCLSLYLDDETVTSLTLNFETVNDVGPAIVEEKTSSMLDSIVSFQSSTSSMLNSLLQVSIERPSLDELDEDSFWDESRGIVRQKLYIGDPGAIAISNVLECNSHLMSLRLDCMAIGDEGASDLARALCKNDTLRILELPNNKICDVGAIKIASMLVVNCTVTLVDLKNNFIGDMGTRKLMLALRKNEVVERRNIKLQKNRAKVSTCFRKREIDVKLGYSDVKATIPKKLFALRYLKDS